jgi:4-hydroxybenzoate polyprenyltransferase
MVRLLLYSNLFITLCAGMMTWEGLHFFTYHSADDKPIILLIAASTLFIYCVHWLLSLRSSYDTPRIHWTRQHRGLMIGLGAIALGIMLYTGWPLRAHWPYILPALGVTSIYTLPKTRLFDSLKLKVIAKTSVLAISWTYITTLMPVWMSGGQVSDALLFFTLGRLFLVYPICLLFDHRDVEQDLREGISTLPARISDKQLKLVFFCSIALSILFMFYSIDLGINFSILNSNILLLPARLLPPLILAMLYTRSTSQLQSRIPRDRSPIPSDLLFYGMLDGLMALSSLLSILIAF